MITNGDTILKKTNNLSYINLSLFAVTSISITIFFFTFTSDDRVAGMFSDDAMYLLQAELYSPWIGEESPISDLVRKSSHFPPLFPIVLGLMGADSNHTVFASVILCCMLILSIIIFGIWIWNESGQLNFTIITLVLFSLLPSTLIMSQGLWSEFLFMCFIYSAFICNDSRIKPEQKWLATALLIALSTLTRAIGVSIAAAFILLLFLNRTKNKLLYITVVILPYFFWTISRNILQDHPSYFDDLFNSSYELSLSNIYEIFFNRITILADSWIWQFSVLKPYDTYQILIASIATILFFLTTIGLLNRLKKLKLDALSVPFYLIIVLIWPYQNTFFVSRFIYPLLPLFLFYMWIGIQSLPVRKKIHNLIIILWVSAVISIAYPSSKQFIERGYKEVPEELMAYRRSRHWLLAPTEETAKMQASFNKRLIETLPKIAEHISENECIYAYQAPVIILYTHRVSSVFPPYTDSTDEFERQTRACNLFLAMNITDINESYPPFYPLQHTANNERYYVQSFYDDSEKKDETGIFLIRRINK